MEPRWRLYLDLIRWNRPAGWLLLLWPSLSGLWIAAGGWPGWHLLSVFVAGTILMRSAGCCINDVADREFDKHVKRTAQRPVTRGAVSVREALSVGAVLAMVAFGLVLTTNPAAVAWSFVALAVTLFYPYAKRLVSMPQAVLGVAVSFGIPMVDRDDDLRIGMKTSAITLGRFDILAVMGFYAVFLGGWWALLQEQAFGWPWGMSLLVATAQVAWHFQLIRTRTREGCFKAFRLNHWLGATVFAGIAVGFALMHS